ncbi:MAG: glycosyltransferase [Planctomycetes bacterium]|nr:glycosyltransferase [Planctomycetota bacterium]
MRRSITLLTRSLAHGGTERQIVVLARGLQASGRPVRVLALYPDGELRDELVRAGIPVRSLGKKGRWDALPFLFRLVSALQQEPPEVLYSFLGVPNILSVLLKGFFPDLQVVWGVRASGLGSFRLDRLGSAIQTLEAWLSRGADLILSNSFAGVDYACSRGFPRNKLTVVHNGIDLEAYRPDRGLGRRLRAEWGIGDDEKLIGLVARLDPMKDHALFLESAARFAQGRAGIRFVCAGGGDPGYAASLARSAERLGLSGKIVWAGDRSDMLELYNAMDVLTLCSETEGFPNALAEGMACGIPCVATDVGDCGRMIEGIGVLAASRTPQALCDAWEEMLVRIAGRGPAIGAEGRARIVERYSIERLVSRTTSLIDAL